MSWIAVRTASTRDVLDCLDSSVQAILDDHQSYPGEVVQSSLDVLAPRSRPPPATQVERHPLMGMGVLEVPRVGRPPDERSVADVTVYDHSAIKKKVINKRCKKKIIDDC
jgi:hypothetical protein